MGNYVFEIQKNPFAVAAWLKQGEHLADQIKVPAYDAYTPSNDNWKISKN